MSATLPPTPLQTGSTPTTASITSGTGQVQTLPPQITAQLQAGKSVQAEVTAKPQAGQVTLQTPQGQVQIETAVPLSVGTKIALSLPPDSKSQRQGQPQTLNIQNLSADPVKAAAMTAQESTPQPLVPIASGTGQATNIPAPILAQLTSGKTVTSDVIAKPEPGHITVQLPASNGAGKIDIQTPLPLPTGTKVNLAMIGTNGPPYSLNIQHLAPAKTNTQPTASQRPLVSDTAPTKITSVPVASGTGETNNLPKAAVALLSTGNTLTALVVAKPQPSQITVQTTQGNFTINTLLPLPEGATLNLAMGEIDGPPHKLNIQYVPKALIKTAPTPLPQPAILTSGTGEAQNLPPQIINALTAEKVVTAEVIAKTQPETITVQTSQGNIDIKTPLPLPTGSTLNLAMSSTDGPPFKFSIQHVTAPPVKTDQYTAPVPLLTSGTGETQSIPRPAITLMTSGNILSAVVVAKPQHEAITVQTSQGNIDIKTPLPLPTGAAVNLAMSSADGPPFKINIQHVPTPPARAEISIAPPPPLTTNGTGETQSLPQPAITLLTSGNILSAEVVAKPQPETITVQTSQGSIDIKTPLPLPTGSTINLAMSNSDGPPFKLDIQHITSSSVKAETSQNLPTLPILKGTGEAPSLPQPAITLLASGNVLSAEVVARPQSDTITLQLPQGKVDVKTPLPLPTGAKVNIAMSEEISPPHKLSLQQVQAPPVKNEAAPQQTAAQPTQVTHGTAEVKSIPQPIMATFESGKTMTAEVVAKPQPGNVTIQTPQGQIQAHTSLPLATGSSVLLSMLSPNGPPFTLNIQNMGLAYDAPIAAKSEIVQSLTSGVTLNATIVKSSAALPQQAPSAAALPTAETPAPTAPTATATPSARSLLPQTVAADSATADKPAQQASVPTAAQAESKPTAAQLPQGGTVPVKINAIQLPGGVALPPIADGQVNLFQGEVISNQNGQLLIQTASSTLSLSVQSPPPVGTMLLLSLEGQPVPAPITPQRLGGPEMMQRWEGLRDAMLLLEAGDPAAAARVMQSMPQVGIKLTTSLMFFMNAFRGGNVDNWFGSQNMQSLSKLSKSTANKVGSDFLTTQGRATDGASNEWRSYNLPMFTDSEIEQLRLYTKDFQEGDDDSDDPDKNGKRFVIEVNFTKLGPFQFDGVARKKTVDLMIRTHKPLEDGMRDDIRSLFSNIIEALGLTGTVGFHVSPKFDVHPIKEDITYGGGMTV